MLLLVVLAVSVAFGETCRPAPGFVFLTFDQVMYRADLVLHGRDMFHTLHPDRDWSWTNRTDSHFQVFCVLKNVLNEPVNEHITIRRISPRNTCETRPTEVGKDYIVMLRRIEDQVYEWEPVKVMHSAAYEATDANLKEIMKICGYQNPTFPMQTGNGNELRCPETINDPNQCRVPPKEN